MTDAPARRAWILLAALSAVPLIVEWAGLLSKDYGYFIDECYYIACAKRLAFGYVDHPPLAPLLLAGTRLVLGDALWAIRLSAFLALSAPVWIAGLVYLLIHRDARGLPNRVIGAQNTYWHWSVGRTNTDVLIAIDANPKTLRELFAEVWEAGRIRCDYCMSWRNDIPIFVARRSIAPSDSVWPRFRHYE